MKNIQFNLIGLVFILAASQLTAQTNTQMPKWPFNGKEVDFTTQQVNNMSSSLASPQFVSNGYYDVNDDLLFHIIDNNMWWGNGNFAGNLFTDTDPIAHPDQMYPEVLVVPKTKGFCSDGSFYVFYAVKKLEEDSKGTNPYISINIMGNEVRPGQGTNSTLDETLGEGVAFIGSVGIAATDFLGTTDNRRLYYVFYSDDDEESRIEFFDVTPNGISGPNTVCTFSNNSKYFEPSEVEISPDNSMLVFTRPKYLANVNDDNSNDLTIVHLNPSTGYLNTSQGVNGFTYVDLGPSNSILDKYMGVEFSANAEYIYVTRHGTGLYEYELSTGISTQISNTSLIANSQLELGRDGKIYGVASNGQLYEINDLGTYGQSNDYNITSSGVITSEIFTSFCPVRTIPDQIDGCAYDDLFGTPEECCYVDTEMPVVNTMGGSVAEVSGDLKVQSNVSWTPTNNPFTTGSSTPEVYFRGDLIIEPGAKLNIDDMIIHFDVDKGIELTHALSGYGSKLDINNTTLTAYDECETEIMWKGIEVFGNDGFQNIDPWTNSQPYVEITNSEIEYAQAGVTCKDAGNAYLSNVTFKDNVKGAVYMSTSFYYSSIVDCLFKTTNDLYVAKNEKPDQHVYLAQASGINIDGTDFKNLANEANIPNGYPDHGNGIQAISSNYTVGYITLPSAPYYDICEFENLYYGINDLGWTATNLEVCKASFVDNKGGIWVRDKSPIILDSDFDVLNADGNSELFDSFGLYLDGCTGYQVEENSFHDGLLGCQIYNSGPVYNEIYKNNFSNLNSNGVATGIVAVGDNYEHRSKNNGLTFLCNEFTNTDYAISVLAGHLPYFDQYSLVVTDISEQQGLLYNSYYKYAGNDFCSTSSVGEHDFYFNGAVSYLGQYEYFDNNLNPELISYDPHDISREQGIGENTCPSNLSGGITKDSDLSLMSLDVEETEKEAEIANATSDINELSLLISAETAGTNNEAEVHEQLMAGAPYLNDTILKTYLFNDQVSELSRTSVLKANSPLTDNVKESLDESGLSPELIAYLDQYQHGVNALEQLTNALKSIKVAKQQVMFNMQRTIINYPDSIDVDSYISSLETENSAFAKQRLYEIYMYNDNFTQAENMLNDLRNLADNGSLSISQDELFIDSLELANAINPSLAATNIENKIDRLYALAEDFNNSACTKARNALETYGYEEYLPMTALPSEVNDKSSTDSEATHEDLTRHDEQFNLEPLFNIFPNPVNDKLSVEFISPEESCSFVIMDVQGRQVKTIQKNEALGFLSIDVSELETGTYILYLPQLNQRKQFVVKR